MSYDQGATVSPKHRDKNLEATDSRKLALE